MKSFIHAIRTLLARWGLRKRRPPISDEFERWASYHGDRPGDDPFMDGTVIHYARRKPKH